MVDFAKPQAGNESIADGTGTWTNVIGYAKVDGQDGIWLTVAGGSSYYYNPSDEIMQNIAFTACADLNNHQVSVLIPANSPAAGLIVNSGNNQ